MSSHEARVNDALKQLGEEYRLGMVQLAEYRSRRRMLLDSWGERDATTSPGSLRAKTATGQTAPNRVPLPASRATAGAPAPEPKRSMAPLIIVVALIVAGAAGYALLRPKAPAPSTAATATPPPEPESPQVAAVRKAADDFLAANAWEAPAIERFLQQWRGLGPEDRAKAADVPSMRTLRYKLDQNIQAESSLVAPDAPPEQRQRLTMLEAFARELAGETP
jgi:hypothetical protein